MDELKSLSPEDRAAYQALSAAMQTAAAVQQQALKQQQKSWITRAADWVEDHPVAVVSCVLIAAVAAECYIISKTARSE